MSLVREDPIDQHGDVGIFVIGAVDGIKLRDHGIRAVPNVLRARVDAVQRDHLDRLVADDAVHIISEGKADRRAENGKRRLRRDLALAHKGVHCRLAAASRKPCHGIDDAIRAADLCPIPVLARVDRADLFDRQRIDGVLFIDEEHESLKPHGNVNELDSLLFGIHLLLCRRRGAEKDIRVAVNDSLVAADGVLILHLRIGREILTVIIVVGELAANVGHRALGIDRVDDRGIDRHERRRTVKHGKILRQFE